MAKFGNKIHYLPALLWSLVILAFTSIPDLSPPSLGFTWQDKFEHFAAYSLFGAAITYGNIRSNKYRAFLGAVIFCSVFGVLDEIHQHWIHGRSTDPYDWVADTSGAFIGSLIVFLLRNYWMARFKSKTTAPK